MCKHENLNSTPQQTHKKPGYGCERLSFYHCERWRENYLWEMLVFTLTPGPVRSIVSHISNKLDSDAAGSPIFSFVLPAHVCSPTHTHALIPPPLQISILAKTCILKNTTWLKFSIVKAERNQACSIKDKATTKYLVKRNRF